MANGVLRDGAYDGRNCGHTPFALLIINADRRLLFPSLFRLRPELSAAALAAAGRPHRVPGVALHADHLVQAATLGLGEAGHWPGEEAEDNEGFGFDTLPRPA